MIAPFNRASGLCDFNLGRLKQILSNEFFRSLKINGMICSRETDANIRRVVSTRITTKTLQKRER